MSGKIFRSSRSERRSSDTERSGEIIGGIGPGALFDAVDVESGGARNPRERDVRPRIRDHRSCAGVDSRSGTRVVGDVAVRAESEIRVCAVRIRRAHVDDCLVFRQGALREEFDSEIAGSETEIRIGSPREIISCAVENGGTDEFRRSVRNRSVTRGNNRESLLIGEDRSGNRGRLRRGEIRRISRYAFSDAQIVDASVDRPVVHLSDDERIGRRRKGRSRDCGDRTSDAVYPNLNSGRSFRHRDVVPLVRGDRLRRAYAVARPVPIVELHGTVGYRSE